jgi:ATP phosphoribosyltransferase regulatory subunit
VKQVSKPKVFEKPAGVKDMLPKAVAKLRKIERSVLDVMKRWGYREIMTPTLEYYDTVGAASSTSDGELFKLLDQKGTTMVLRSDLTAPIARVVASMLKDEPFPLKLCYHANVFRAIEEGAGREAEFYQTGVELVGDAAPDADAEIVALAVASLEAAGVRQFKIALGHAGFLDGLFREALSDVPEAQTALKACLQHRNYVGFRATVRQLALPETVKERLQEILRLCGGKDVCERARQLTHDAAAQAAVDHLEEIWDVLDAYGVSEYVMIDLTMIGNFSYYTGMIFEGYSADLGFPVVSGGRYDNLLTQFGRPAPATGFALKTNRILGIVNGEQEGASGRFLVLYTANRRKEAFAFARELRARGDAVVETKKVESGRRGAWAEAVSPHVYRFNQQLYEEVFEFVDE